jgi:hypothetical protein
LQVAAQAVEAELDRAEPHPVAPAIDAGAARFHTLLHGDREIDLPPKSMRSGPSSTSISTASASLAPVSFRTARATA